MTIFYFDGASFDDLFFFIDMKYHIRDDLLWLEGVKEENCIKDTHEPNESSIRSLSTFSRVVHPRLFSIVFSSFLRIVFVTFDAQDTCFDGFHIFNKKKTLMQNALKIHYFLTLNISKKLYTYIKFVIYKYICVENVCV